MDIFQVTIRFTANICFPTLHFHDFDFTYFSTTVTYILSSVPTLNP